MVNPEFHGAGDSGKKELAVDRRTLLHDMIERWAAMGGGLQVSLSERDDKSYLNGPVSGEALIIDWLIGKDAIWLNYAKDDIRALVKQYGADEQALRRLTLLGQAVDRIAQR